MSASPPSLKKAPEPVKADAKTEVKVESKSTHLDPKDPLENALINLHMAHAVAHRISGGNLLRPFATPQLIQLRSVMDQIKGTLEEFGQPIDPDHWLARIPAHANY
jgi:hypothetical protein